MPAWLAKVGLKALSDPDKAIKLLFIGIMAIFGAIFILLSPFFLLFMPAAESSQVEYYIDAAKKMQDETGLSIDWREIVALDAVVLEQDFEKVNASRPYNFYRNKLIWEEEQEVSATCTDEDGNDYDCSYTITVYHKRSIEEVMLLLDLSVVQMELVMNYLSMISEEDIIDPGFDIGPVTGTQPGNFTPVINQFTWPIDSYYLTSGFGGRVDPVTGIPGEIHGGIDIRASIGTEVRATMKGTVTFARYTESGGNIVAIDHGNKYTTRYLHLDQILVSVGDEVEQDEVIALSGNTGKRTTGPHLHYEIHYEGKKMDPILYYQ